VILNVDGSAPTNLDFARFGCLVRRQDGSFEFGFHWSVGWSNSLHVEI